MHLTVRYVECIFQKCSIAVTNGFFLVQICAMTSVPTGGTGTSHIYAFKRAQKGPQKGLNCYFQDYGPIYWKVLEQGWNGT